MYSKFSYSSHGKIDFYYIHNTEFLIFLVVLYFWLCIYMWVHLRVSASEWSYVWRLEEDAGSPGATVTGSYEKLNVRAEKETQGLYRSSFNFWAISLGLLLKILK